MKIQAGPKGTVHGARVRFKFSVPGASSYQCRIDGGHWKPCTSPASFNVSPGHHVFQVRALSASGATGPVAKRAFQRAAKKRRHHHGTGGSGRRTS